MFVVIQFNSNEYLIDKGKVLFGGGESVKRRVSYRFILSKFTFKFWNTASLLYIVSTNVAFCYNYYKVSLYL